MRELVFVSLNKHKLAEAEQILGDSYLILNPNDLGFDAEIEETAETFEGNALIKAKTIFDLYKMDCFSDDSGLCVESLNGKPGVMSARYAGEPGNAEKNIEKLLAELGTETNRKASFVTVICLIFQNKQWFFKGEVHGVISKEKRGNSGFGYDPVFVPDGYDLSFAEMTQAQKNSISHRKLALEQVRIFLESYS